MNRPQYHHKSENPKRPNNPPCYYKTETSKPPPDTNTQRYLGTHRAMPFTTPHEHTYRMEPLRNYRLGRPVRPQTRSPLGPRTEIRNSVEQRLDGIIIARQMMLKQDIKIEQNNNDVNSNVVQRRIKSLTQQCERDLRNLESVDIDDPHGARFNYLSSDLKHRHDLTEDEKSILARAKDWQITRDIERQQEHQCKCAYAAIDKLNNIIETFLRQYHKALKPEDTFDLIWDSGASMCITNKKSDFVSDFMTINSGATIQGIGSGLHIQGKGIVEWSVTDVTGKLRHFHLPAYYVPKSPAKLLSTSVFCAKYPSYTISIKDECWTLKNKSNTSPCIDIHVSNITNLPTSKCFRSKRLSETAAFFAKTINETHENNINLSEPQKELLRWHSAQCNSSCKTDHWQALKHYVICTHEYPRSCRTIYPSAQHVNLDDKPIV